MFIEQNEIKRKPHYGDDGSKYLEKVPQMFEALLAKYKLSKSGENGTMYSPNPYMVDGFYGQERMEIAVSYPRQYKRF